uniref:Reverse transcriptase/retrotransposon-derived protein RNase H-like domain-containing protein n=1 Tax=Cannabis sativa TaxID=3483 RepID=A0A803PVP2_CANSA
MAALSRFISKSTEMCVPFFNIKRRCRKFEWTEEFETAFMNLKEHIHCPKWCRDLTEKLIEGFRDRDFDRIVLLVGVSSQAGLAQVEVSKDGCSLCTCNACHQPVMEDRRRVWRINH